MPGKNGDLKKAAHDAREVRYAPEDADIHPLAHDTGDEFIDRLRHLGSMEPGSAEFNAQHLVGSMAPEEVIEVMGHVGGEGLGVTHVLDGKTGEIVARPNTLIRDWWR